MKSYRVVHICGHAGSYVFDGAKLRQLAVAEELRGRRCLACTADSGLLPTLHVDRDFHIVDPATYAGVHTSLAQALATVRGEETFSAYLAAVPVARRSHQRIARRRMGARAVFLNGEWIEGTLLTSGLVRCAGLIGGEGPGAKARDAWVGLPRNTSALSDLFNHVARAGARIVDHRARRSAPPQPRPAGGEAPPVIEVATEPAPMQTFGEMLSALDETLAAWDRKHPAWAPKLEEELAAAEARRLESLNIE